MPGIGASRRRINIVEHQNIRVAKRPGKFIKERLGARKAVRLENHNQPALPHLPGRGQRRHNFRRVMSVIIHHRDLACPVP